MDLAAFERGAIANAVDLQLLAETFRSSVHGIGQQGSHQPMFGAQIAAVIVPGHFHDSIFDLHRNPRQHRLAHLTLGAFGHENLILERHFDALGDRDGLFSYTRHDTGLLPDLTKDLASDATLSRL